MNAHLYNVRKILKINFLCILFGPILLYRRRSFLPKNQKWTITASLSQQEEKVKSKKKKWCWYWSSSDVRLRGGRYKVETPANNSQSAASQGNRKKKTGQTNGISSTYAAMVSTQPCPFSLRSYRCYAWQDEHEHWMYHLPKCYRNSSSYFPSRTSLMLIRPFMHDTANSP